MRHKEMHSLSTVNAKQQIYIQGIIQLKMQLVGVIL